MTNKVSYQIQVDAPANHVWNILADFGGIYKFNPGVTKSELLSSNNEGVGADRICYLAPSGQIQERILDWQEGKEYSLEIYTGKGSPPFKKAIANLKVEPNGAGSTVYATLDYSLKFGILGRIMNTLLFGRFLDRGFSGLLAGLKHYAETGEEVNGAKGLQFTAVPA